MKVFFQRHGRLLLIFSLLMASLFFMTDANAVTDPGGVLNSIVNLYQGKTAQWESSLTGFAKDLFWSLAAIDFLWMGLRLTLKSADFGEWLGDLVNQILFIGFFYTLLVNSSSWSQDIINSFSHAANQASGAAGGVNGITPSGIFNVGLSLSLKVIEQTSLWSPADSVGLMIAALLIIICFALIAANMVETLIESYFVVSAGVFMMGFGGSRWTKEYAISTLKYTMSVGAKLFALQLLVGLGENMIQGWVNDFQNKNIDIFVMCGSAIVMLALTKDIPAKVQAVINGSSIGGSGGLMGTAGGVAAMAAGTATAMVGAGLAVKAAGQLASTQVAAAGADSGMASLLGKTAKNLGQAASQDIGRKLSGRAHHGSIGGRMADMLGQQNKDLQADRQKPQAVVPNAETSGGSMNSSDNTIS